MTPSVWTLALLLVGTAAIVAGVTWIYPPAGLIVGGLLVVAAALGLVDVDDRKGRPW